MSVLETANCICCWMNAFSTAIQVSQVVHASGYVVGGGFLGARDPGDSYVRASDLMKSL